jgi:SH3-like domain-containing protein
LRATVAAIGLIVVGVVASGPIRALERQLQRSQPAVAPSAPPPRQAPAAPVERGSVTSLPIPRYVSLKTTEGYARRGPSTAHRIDWVFTRKDMPLQVIDEYDHWREVRDRDGATGWVHYSLLSGVRTVIVEKDLVGLHMTPDDGSPVAANAETGVIARLGECSRDWCRISADGYRGWVRKTALWGVDPDETRE